MKVSASIDIQQIACASFAHAVSLRIEQQQTYELASSVTCSATADKSRSTPMHDRAMCWATSNVVPVPINGSSTTPGWKPVPHPQSVHPRDFRLGNVNSR